MGRIDVRRRFLLAGGPALLAGCSTPNTPKPPPTERQEGFRFELDGRSGAVVGSFELFVTERGPFPLGCALFMEEAAEIARLVRDGEKGFRERAFAGPGYPDRADFHTAFPSAALVSAAVVPAVEHCFKTLWATPRGGDFDSLDIALPPLRFTPRVDRITYVGNVAVLVRAWNPWPSLGLLAVRDMSLRDVPRLRERYPWIGGRRLETALASGFGWTNAVPGSAA